MLGAHRCPSVTNQEAGNCASHDCKIRKEVCVLPPLAKLQKSALSLGEQSTGPAYMTSALAPLPPEGNSICSETAGLKGVQRLVIVALGEGEGERVKRKEGEGGS